MSRAAQPGRVHRLVSHRTCWPASMPGRFATSVVELAPRQHGSSMYHLRLGIGGHGRATEAASSCLSTVDRNGGKARYGYENTHGVVGLALYFCAKDVDVGCPKLLRRKPAF